MSIEAQSILETSFELPKQTAFYRGKVRDVYSLDEQLIMVASDRISAFDHVLPRPIPFKGQVLNQVATHFLRATEDICPNWLEATPDENVAVGVKCEAYPIEMVIRGYLTGHAWREYKLGKRILCGVEMPDGMKEHDKFTEMAATQGLILVDTKYEFGKKGEQIYVIDEIHTPDRSRYFYKDGYQARQDTGEPQKQLSKEFVREWLMENGFRGLEGQIMPVMPDDFVWKVSERYIELYEIITGQKFQKADTANVIARIEQNILTFLNY